MSVVQKVLAQGAASVGRLQPANTLFLLCDVQEKFRTVIPHFAEMLANTQKLLLAGRTLQVPLLVTEQYPEKLGRTVADLDIAHANAVLSKSLFSMVTPEVQQKFNELFDDKQRLQSVVLFGIESHVCVEQTAMDLRELNLDVHVVADCSASRSADDRRFAFERMRQIGCFLTTSENVIFKLLRSKDNPCFNDVRRLVTKTSEDTGLSKL